MKYILILLVYACGGWHQKDCYVSGKDCEHYKHTEQTTQGPRGAVGPRGADGETIVGPSGENGETIIGPKGDKGDVGESTPSTLLMVTRFTEGFTDCPSGSGLLVASGQDLDANGDLDPTEIQQLSSVCDGERGSDGESVVGPPGPASVIAIVDPCGTETAYDEVLLQLSTGQLLAHYSHGAKQHLTYLPAGVYETTDGTHCVFTVNSDLTVSWED